MLQQKYTIEYNKLYRILLPKVNTEIVSVAFEMKTFN